MSIIIHSLPCSFLDLTYVTSFCGDYDAQDSCFGFCDDGNAFLYYDFETDDDVIYYKNHIQKSLSYAGELMHSLDNGFNNINIKSALK